MCFLCMLSYTNMRRVPRRKLELSWLAKNVCVLDYYTIYVTTVYEQGHRLSNRYITSHTL